MLPPASLPVRPRAQRDELRKQAFSGGLRAAGPIQEEQQAGPEGVEAVDEQLVAEEECGDGFSCEDRPVASGHGAGAPLPSWDAYWDARQEVDVPSRGGRFNVYAAGALGPVILCCHGGGYTGLTWSLMAAHLKDKYRVVAPDLRGHGLTTTANDADTSKEVFAEDLVAIWQHMFGVGSSSQHPAQQAGPQASSPHPPAPALHAATAAPIAPGPPATVATTASAPGQPEPPPVLLVGHSMGGAVAVWAAALGRIKNLAGVVVVDVVEGTAIAALPSMMGIVARRPKCFASPEAAVAWALRTGMCKVREAACISVPAQLQQQGADRPGVHEGRGPGEQGGGAGSSWGWRTDLAATQPFWHGWYEGLSDAFLKLPAPKMLMLAGTDRLDKPLTIGQMQGKFQLVLLPLAGHAVHEDESTAAADHIRTFMQRFRVGEPPLVIPRASGVRPVLPVVAGPVHTGPAGGLREQHRGQGGGS